MINEKCIVLIPARMESSRLPGKALKEIGGIPMVVHVAIRSSQCPTTDRTIVCTDSADIIFECEKYGIEACNTRGNHRNGTERIAEAAMLSITSTSTASCGCSKCAFTITSHGILDHCPVRNLMQTGLNVKLLLCKCLKLSNDLTTYSLLWKNVLNKIITNQKEVNWKFKRRLLCTRTFVKVFEDVTELPNDCLDIIFAYLNRDVTRYGKVLYRNDLGCQWTVDELSLKNYFNRSASTK